MKVSWLHVRNFHGVARGINRAFSSAASAESQKAKAFISQRSKYREEMKDLRKEWTKEIAERRELEKRRIELEKEKVVLAKAIRLREKRKESVLRQEADKKAKAAANERYQAHLQRNLVLHNERVAEQAKIDKLYGIDIEEEKKTWINEDNMNSKITAALFEKPATSGLLTRDSELWRWHLHSMKLDRLMNNSETSSDFAGSSLAERLEFRGQVRSARKIMVQDFLEPMIESGSERAEYDELVDRFTTKFEELDVWHKADEVDDFFFDEDSLSNSSFASANNANDGKSTGGDMEASSHDGEGEAVGGGDLDAAGIAGKDEEMPKAANKQKKPDGKRGRR